MQIPGVGSVIELSRYSLELLRNDKEVDLYRGRSDHDEPQILVLSPVTEYPAPETLKRLEHEHSLREELHADWAARPIAITHHWNRTVLVLQDPGGVPLDQLFGPVRSPGPHALREALRARASAAADADGQPLELVFALRLAVELSGVIDRLHQRGIIHKDIKPANVLADRLTGRCWLKGFGIASRLPRERQSAEPPELVAGTLAYMAPEQTGRMNRSTDRRSDLYAFGVSLYEMLTGTLPFMASDPMEWVHCHIARKPAPPEERARWIPPSVSGIVMKLLAKTAEERYQTAAGAKRDLQRCLDELEGLRPRDPLSRRTIRNTPTLQHSVTPAAGIEDEGDDEDEYEMANEISVFPLGEFDTPDQLLIPEKLYGRAREISTLLASFHRVVTSGKPELVLVSGYSGIGKSSVVSELQRVLVPTRGFFASGKFDQHKRDIPYSTLAQAFQGLIRPLLGKSDAELKHWRDAFQQALGQNGQLIIDLVAELAVIIGEQPPLMELPPQDAQRRFQLVIRRFIGVFAQPQHPLALFLDDLQWLDAATLDLLEDLLTSDFANQQRSEPAEPELRRTSQPAVQHLLLIGAYRDNEASANHPLMHRLEAIRRAGAIIHELVLAPLSCEDLGRLIADSLHCKLERVTSLAQLVHEKTAGNPFFAIQFISALAEESLLRFDHASRSWTWDVSRIGSKGFTDNVVDLMLGKLNRLPVETQKALKALACLGNSAEIATLAVVQGMSEEQVHADFWEALRLEFIVRSEGSYKFVHDRIQEAAYSLISEQLRPEAHLRIGRILRVHTPAHKLEERIFEIVNQFNRGAALIVTQGEREQVAELNLVAGKRAKSATAYVSALRYLTEGRTLLGENAREECHQLTFQLELNRAECEYLTGKLALAEEHLSALSSRAQSIVESAAVSCMRINLYTTLDRSDSAVEVGLDYLQQVDAAWPAHPTADDVQQEYSRLWVELGSRPIEAILDLPLMSDAEKSATMDVLTVLTIPALFTDLNLCRLIVGRMATLSLEHGNSDGSCLAYEWLGGVLGTYFGKYEAGYRFGRLGLKLVEKYGLDRFKARVYVVFAVHVAHWTQPLQISRDALRRGFLAARDAGDLSYATYSCIDLITNRFAAGDPLSEVEREAEDGLEFARKVSFGLAIDCITGQLRLIRMLRGRTPDFTSFNDAEFDEERFAQHLENNPQLAIGACYYWVRKLQACVYAGDGASGIVAASKVASLLWTAPAQFEHAEYHFYGALARAAHCDKVLVEERFQHLEALAAHHKLLTVWATNCPENFANRAALVEAEIARIEGRALDAMDLYEQAIRSARASGFLHNEALASELAARFYAARGFDQIADGYLRRARSGYLAWGADGKVRQLDDLHPQLREEEWVPGPTSTIGASVEHLDLATVIKVSQTVSGEIVLEKLIDTLMRTALEHAGAERGLLVLLRDAEQRIEAEAITSGDTIIVRLREASARNASASGGREDVGPSAADAGGFISEAELPESIIHYVVRASESVILDDASIQNPFSNDDYFRKHQLRSVLCLPLIKQTKVIGVLYLENNLAPYVFTPTRIAVLKLLASQAAICLENTRLYRDLGAREARIRRLVDANIIGIFIWKVAGQIIEANEAFLSMVNYSREDLVSGRLNWIEMTPPEWRDLTEHGITQLKTTGVLQQYEKEYIRSDGSRAPVLVGSALFEEDQNEGVSFVVDLNERKRSEEALRRREADLREAQAELAHVSRVVTMGELTASIAHEVNQPLSAALNNASACLRWMAANDPEEARQSASLVISNVRRAGEIIAGIRALAKKAPPRKEPLDINETIREVFPLVRSALHSNHVSLQTDLANDLPLIIGDRVQLQQVVLNLLINAIEAMAEIEGDPRILRVSSERTIELSDNSEHALIAVRDSGPGLDMNGLKRLFDTFYTTKPQGLGMGLAISRSIVEANGGRLWAENAPKGALLQFTLPILPGRVSSKQ
jgi:PAS domain S-box-containing protein